TVLAVLVDNKLYPDPYYGTNLKSIPGYLDGNWLIMKEGSPFRHPWWYRVEFSLPNESKGRLVTLHFDGISYQTNVWLNGQQIADRETIPSTVSWRARSRPSSFPRKCCSNRARAGRCSSSRNPFRS